MKKILVLTLVLGMAAMANATLTMTTTYDGSDLAPGDTFTIDINEDAMMFPIVSETLAVIVSDTTLADVYGGTAMEAANAADKILIWDDMSSPGWAEDAGVAMNIGILGGVYPAPPYVVFDNIMFECLGDGDVMLMFVTGVLGPTDEYIVGQVLAEVMVSQIPEPMTLALLGLGGLFLRRRK